MNPARFDQWIGQRLADDPVLARLLAPLGERVAFEAGAEHSGEGHWAPLGVVVDRPMRMQVRMEPTGAPGCLQAARFALGPLGADARSDDWLPILDVGPDQADRWVASRRFGAWGTTGGRRLGYQGWWQERPGAGRADLRTRVVAHSRHARGSMLWIGSHTTPDAPGELHKQVLAVLSDDDA
jgi:hypothetical protein